MNLFTCHIMTTVMTALKSNLPMVSVITMVLNGFGCMDFMSKLKSILIPKTWTETDSLVCCNNITITSITMNGVLFLKWQTKMEILTNTPVQLRPGRSQVFFWLGMLSINTQRKIKMLRKQNKNLIRNLDNS